MLSKFLGSTSILLHPYTEVGDEAAGSKTIQWAGEVRGSMSLAYGAGVQASATAVIPIQVGMRNRL